MADSNDTDPGVARELEQARQALDDATKARKADLSDAAVINRLYYAAFHAIQAVLYSGSEAKAHSFTGGMKPTTGNLSTLVATVGVGYLCNIFR